MSTDCICSGAQRAPCRLAACAAWILWREASRFVIARRPKADVAISGRQLHFRQKYPVIRPGSARFPRRFAPRNDTSGWCGGAPVPSCSGIAPYRALTARKGHAASVRRQSRQRLRSERCRRRNRFLRFYRQPVRIASAAPGMAVSALTILSKFRKL